MQVVAHHPAPYRHVAKGRRSVSDGLVRIATPVALTVLDEGGMERVRGVPGGGMDLSLHEGALWTRLSLRIPVPGNPFHPRKARFDPHALVAWLGAPEAPSDPHGLAIGRAFSGTPLTGFWNEHGPPYPDSTLQRWVDRESGGDPEPASSRVFLDDRERAADDVRAFLRDEVRVCGDGVFLRAGLMARMSAIGGIVHLSASRELRVDAPPPLRADLHGDFGRSVYHPAASGDTGGLRRFLERLPGGALDDADLRVLANGLPGTAVALANLAAARRLDAPQADDALRAMALRGRVGGVRPEERTGAARAALDYIGAFVDAPAVRRSVTADALRLERMASFVAERVMPRMLSGPAPDAGDVESLSALAP